MPTSDHIAQAEVEMVVPATLHAAATPSQGLQSPTLADHPVASLEVGDTGHVPVSHQAICTVKRFRKCSLSAPDLRALPLLDSQQASLSQDMHFVLPTSKASNHCLPPAMEAPATLGFKPPSSKAPSGLLLGFRPIAPGLQSVPAPIPPPVLMCSTPRVSARGRVCTQQLQPPIHHSPVTFGLGPAPRSVLARPPVGPYTREATMACPLPRPTFKPKATYPSPQDIPCAGPAVPEFVMIFLGRLRLRDVWLQQSGSGRPSC